jgi:hypothetical protein
MVHIGGIGKPRRHSSRESPPPSTTWLGRHGLSPLRKFIEIRAAPPPATTWLGREALSRANRFSSNNPNNNNNIYAGEPRRVPSDPSETPVWGPSVKAHPAIPFAYLQRRILAETFTTPRHNGLCRVQGRNQDCSVLRRSLWST